MREKRKVLIGLIVYLWIVMVLFKLSLKRVFMPLPIFTVLGGGVILSLAHLKDKTLWMAHFKMGVLTAGSLATLLIVLSSYASGINGLSEGLIPAIYGALFYLIIDFITPKTNSERLSGNLSENWETEQVATPFFLHYSLTPRECHVALKMIQGEDNKTMAETLYISESTLKKHVQSIYKKVGVGDRQAYLKRYLEFISH